jgi:hypothetical protein
VIPAVLACLLAAVVLAALEWGRFCARCYVALAGWMRSVGPAPHTRDRAGDGGVGQDAKHRPPEGVDGPRSGGYVQPPAVDFARRDYHLFALAAVPFGTALQPDFDAFFGGLEAAVAAGGVLLIACVVVVAIRRFVSF